MGGEALVRKAALLTTMLVGAVLAAPLTAGAGHGSRPDLPNCPFSSAPGAVVVDLGGTALAAWDAERARTAPVSVVLPAGEWEVHLVSYDDHSRTPDQHQLEEQWFLVGTTGGEESFVSGTTPDLPEEADLATFQVGAIVTTDATEQVHAVHAGYPDNFEPHSVVPLCAAFNPPGSAPVPAPLCPFEPGPGVVAITSTAIVANDPDRAETGPIPAAVGAGTWDVYLVSHDDRSAKAGQHQPGERWFLRAWRGGILQTETPATPDLPDGEDLAAYFVGTVEVSEDVDAISAAHAGFLGSDPDSVVPVCAAFVPSDGPPPGVVNPPSTTTTTVPSTPPLLPDPEGPPPIEVAPGDDLGALARSEPEGTTFLLLPGVHRGSAVEPRNAQRFVGSQGAVMNGALELSGFVADGERWVLGGQTAGRSPHGECLDDRPRCRHPEELFIDDVVQRHVGSIGDVGPGSWFFDYEADRIYLGEDPTGRKVELSVTAQAFRGDADDVTIRGLVIEKYASQAQQGALDSRRDTSDRVGGQDWVIRDNVVRWNHGVGIAATTGGLIEGNRVYQNGQLGLAAKGSGVTFENNEVFENNTAGFDPGWEAGGSKFAFTSGLVVRNNYVHANHGPGLWTDIDNIDTRYENNRVIDNDRMGIFHEISYDAVIVGNEVRGNGFGADDWVWGAGILVAISPNVEVVGNTVVGNADGIIGVLQDRSDAPAGLGPLSLSNLSVHANIVAGNGGWTGIGQDIGSVDVFTSQNNRFFNNTYEQDGEHFFWLNRTLTLEEWLALGLS